MRPSRQQRQPFMLDISSSSSEGGGAENGLGGGVTAVPASGSSVTSVNNRAPQHHLTWNDSADTLEEIEECDLLRSTSEESDLYQRGPPLPSSRRLPPHPPMSSSYAPASSKSFDSTDLDYSTKPTNLPSSHPTSPRHRHPHHHHHHSPPQHQHHHAGKFNRPRRRAAAAVAQQSSRHSNSNSHHSSSSSNHSRRTNNNHTNSTHHHLRSDWSVTSENSTTTEHSMHSRYSTTSRLSQRASAAAGGGGGASGSSVTGLLGDTFNTLGSHGQLYLQSQLPQHYSSSTSSLFGLGSTFSGNNNSTSSSPSSSLFLSPTSTLHHSTSAPYLDKRGRAATITNSMSSSALDDTPPHYGKTESSSSSPLPPPPPPLPSLKLIASELVLICSLYCRYAFRSLRKPCQRFRRRLFYGILTVMALLLLLVTWLMLDFYLDAVDICTPPPGHHDNSGRFESFFSSQIGGGGGLIDHPHYDSGRAGSGTDNTEFYANQEENDDEERPLVEYYVHGRGIGHYARSVAIVEQLNRAGIDVRMFLTRSAMWRAMHEDSKMVDAYAGGGGGGASDAEDSLGMDGATASAVGHKSSVLHHPRKHRGRTTAISVASLTPDLKLYDVVSRVLERVSGDCEVAASSGRYPQLVISDGDMPGMLRAEFGGIPSVGIAHGQLFSIAQKPTWVQNVPILDRAWSKQGRLNYASGFFTEWQIATHFCFLESRYASGTVARAPLRPEVLQMADARKAAREGVFDADQLPQRNRIQKLLLHDLHQNFDHGNSDEGTLKNRTASTPIARKRRKLVICYFRDHNGEIVVQALLDAGFDVLLFDNGYYRDIQNDPNRYGVKWIVRDPKESLTAHIRGDERRRLLQKDSRSVANSTGSIGDAEGNSTTTLLPSRHRRLAEAIRSGNQNGPRLIRVTDRSLFVPLMHVADGVASSAGSQLMSECIYSHMPLLALYKEADDEQRLNVELSNHADAPCHRSLVFGTSFEGLTQGLKKNKTNPEERYNLGLTLDALIKFIQEVRASPISETYFRKVSNDTSTPSHETLVSAAIEAMDLDKDPFQGLPDAAAIILEIVKQVLQKR